MTEIDLPQGPRELFYAAYPLLDEYFGANAIFLGGGTALAARWHHRHSTDIDLFTDYVHYRTKLRGRDRQFRKDLEQMLPELQTATFTPAICRLVLAGGEVSLVTSPSVTGLPRSDEIVRGTEVPLESSAEILARKLSYRMIDTATIIPRDLYDLACARFHDPEALSTAINTIIPENRQDLIRELRSLPRGWIDNQQLRVLSPARPNDVRNAVELTARLLERTLDASVSPLRQKRDFDMGL